MAEKTIASKSGVVVIDGLPSFKVSIAELLEGGIEPTGKAIQLHNARKLVTLHDLKDENGGPVTLTLTLRVERTPMTQAEAESIVVKRQTTEANAAKRADKEAQATKNVIQAVQETAIKVAQSSVNNTAGNDPVALAFKIAAGMTGQKSLGSGQ